MPITAAVSRHQAGLRGFGASSGAAAATMR